MLEKQETLDVNLNQIKKVYIANGGSNYTSGIVPINGDGSGAKVSIEVDASGTITSAVVTAGGSGYTYGIVDLGSSTIRNFSRSCQN